MKTTKESRKIRKRAEMMNMEASLLDIQINEARILKMRDASMASAMKARIYRLATRKEIDLTVSLEENTLIVTRLK